MTMTEYGDCSERTLDEMILGTDPELLNMLNSECFISVSPYRDCHKRNSGS